MASAEVPMEVAEDGAGDGGRLAAMAVGLDVTADGKLHDLERRRSEAFRDSAPAPKNLEPRRIKASRRRRNKVSAK